MPSWWTGWNFKSGLSIKNCCNFSSADGNDELMKVLLIFLFSFWLCCCLENDWVGKLEQKYFNWRIWGKFFLFWFFQNVLKSQNLRRIFNRVFNSCIFLCKFLGIEKVYNIPYRITWTNNTFNVFYLKFTSHKKKILLGCFQTFFLFFIATKLKLFHAQRSSWFTFICN